MTSYAKGINAELQAKRYLEQLGYRIIYERHKTPHGEIDLIALSKDTLHCIEVKYRRTQTIALNALQPRQFKRTLDAIEYFIHTHPQYAQHAISYDLLTLDKEGKIQYLCNISNN